MKKLVISLLLISSLGSLHAQVGFNNVNPDPSSLLDLNASDKGLLVPRMTSAFRSAINLPGQSLLVFDTTLEGFYFYNAGTWYSLNEWVRAAGSNTVSLSGNASVTGNFSSGSISNSGGLSTSSLTTGGITSSNINNSGAINTTSLSAGSVSSGNLSSSGGVSGASLSISGFATNALIPSGAIIMWSGSIASIPAGWALCDGASGTPDLRGRFVIGSGGSYSPGFAGGAEQITLNANQLPEHVHLINDNPAAPQVNTTGYTIQSNFNFGGPSSATTRKNVTSNSPVDIRPPYYSLAYIMKL
jgi:Phage Tail Collar Domain